MKRMNRREGLISGNGRARIEKPGGMGRELVRATKGRSRKGKKRCGGGKKKSK